MKSVKNINKTTCKSQNKIATKRQRKNFNRKKNPRMMKFKNKNKNDPKNNKLQNNNKFDGLFIYLKIVGGEIKKKTFVILSIIYRLKIVEDEIKRHL
jgi:hypothetical protein